jgi:hypothetical protein
MNKRTQPKLTMMNPPANRVTFYTHFITITSLKRILDDKTII